MINLDSMATTPIDAVVLEKMVEAWRGYEGNPHVRDHSLGKRSSLRVEDSRREIAGVLGVSPLEIVFVSGATEANNMVLKGMARTMKLRGRDHVVSVASEHACVLESVRRLEREGFRTTLLPIDAEGYVDEGVWDEVLDDRTACVSVMTANNEIGVIQNVELIARKAQEVGAWMHSDGAQALGKMALPRGLWGVDAMSFSGHKIYGPCGVGVLYVRRGVKLDCFMDGGGQERGRRSGTVPVPLVVGMGEAVKRCVEALDCGEEGRIRGLRDRLWEGLRDALPGVRVNGGMERRLAGNLNVYVPLGLWGKTESFLDDFADKVAFSRGSACVGSKGGVSEVMKALGQDEGDRGVNMRFGVGRGTTLEEIERVIDFAREVGRGV